MTNDCVKVVSQSITLWPDGERMVGLCPFHEANAPSLAVHKEVDRWHCYGCHAGGDSVSFLMLREGLTAEQAIRKAREITGS